MAGLTYTNTSLTSTSDADELNENFADVVNKLDRGLTNNEVASSAGISAKKLSAGATEKMIYLKYIYDGTALSAKTAGTPLYFVPLLEPPKLGAYRVSSADWACIDTGDGATTFDVSLGYYDSSNSLVELYKVIEEETITNGPAGAGSNFQGSCTLDRPDISWDTITTTQPLFLYLSRGATAGSGTVDSDTDQLVVTLRLVVDLV